MKYCDACETYHREDGNCLPVFLVYHREIGYRMRIRALDFQDAAERWAELYDNGDGEYALVNGQQLTVRVQDATDVVEFFRIQGESVPQYSAEEVSTEE